MYERNSGEPDAQGVVFIVDDDESVLRGLGRMLKAGGFRVRSYASACEFLAAHDPAIPGCLIADVFMPQMNGLELQRTLLSQGSERPVIFITGYEDIPITVQGMKAGAVSFLPKPVERAQLLSTVQDALSKDAGKRVLQSARLDVLRRIESLTPREHEVLKLVSRGLLNKQIAAELGASEKTIKVHRGRLMAKMQVKSAAALVGTLAHLTRHSPHAEAHLDIASLRATAHVEGGRKDPAGSFNGGGFVETDPS